MKISKEAFVKGIFLACACVSIAAVITICLFLFYNGLPAIFKIGLKEFVTGTKWKPQEGLYGILPMIVGSIYVTIGAIIVGVPMGVMCAVYTSNFCSKKKYRIIKPVIDLMAGIPSVVYGFFGLTIVVPLISSISSGSGKGIIASSLILGIMILPTVISVCEESLRAVPQNYLEGALALGATRERSVFRVVLPAAKSGVVAGVILGTGRAIGEALAVSMVAGNQAILPKSIFSGVRTLTSNIVLEMGYAADLHRGALIATGVVLFVFILVINISFSLFKRRNDN